jgi:hypothetical protein
MSERHGAAARDLQQCRSVEAAEHDAEASVERHLAEHLRRRHAGGEDCLGHPRLLLAEPRRETLLEQFYDLTWRPGVDVRRAASVCSIPTRKRRKRRILSPRDGVWNDETVARVRHAFAGALLECGDNDMLRESIAAYQQVLESQARTARPARLGSDAGH